MTLITNRRRFIAGSAALAASAALPMRAAQAASGPLSVWKFGGTPREVEMWPVQDQAFMAQNPGIQFDYTYYFGQIRRQRILAGFQTRRLADVIIAAQLEDPRINGYFRNASIDHDNMAVCMAEVFESFATGQPPGDADCELDMASVHAGLGVSTVDFDDWVENLETAMDGLGIAPADAAEFVAAVVPAGDDIIEDPDSNATLYQRLGRRPGIDHAVFHFVNKILMNPQVARYFLDADGLPDYSSTFNTCLVRLLGSLDGPFIYGEGFPLESTLADEGRACRDMAATHQNMTSAPPEEDPITGAEFLEVAGALVDALLYLQVPQEDIDLLVAAMNLPALCNAILGDPSECTLLFPPATSD